MTADVQFRVGVSWDRSASFNWSGLDNVTDYVKHVSGNRGFGYDPLFSFIEGGATIKLVNKDGIFDALLDVNLPVIVQVVCNEQYVSVWSGTVTEFTKDTGAAATFVTLKAKDGVYDIRQITRFEAAYENTPIDDIIMNLLSTYSSPTNAGWQLGNGILGSTTYLGGIGTQPDNEYYEESDAIFTYSGTWVIHPYDGPSGGVYRYSNDPAAYVEFSFSGNELWYIRALAFNRGTARITIDEGTSEEITADVDSYDPSIIWQVPYKITGLSDGAHTCKIENTGTDYIDIDAIEVVSYSWETMNFIYDARYSDFDTLTLYVPEASYDSLREVRKPEDKPASVFASVQDLLDVDGSIMFVDGNGKLVLRSYQQILRHAARADAYDVGDKANSSEFRSVGLSDLVTKAVVRYKTKVYSPYTLMAQTGGGAVEPYSTTVKSLPVNDDVYPAAGALTILVEPSAGLSIVSSIEDRTITVELTNSTATGISINQLWVYGPAYSVTDVPDFERVDSNSVAKYGLFEKLMENSAIETEGQATALANRVIAYFGVSADRIRTFTLSKRFKEEALSIELGDIYLIVESATGIDRVAHIVTGIHFTIGPNNVQFDVSLEPMQQRVWVLGLNELGINTYIL